MAAGRIILPCMPALDGNGRPVPGAEMNFYENEAIGTRKAVYTTADLDIPLTNPVVANASGVFPSIFAEVGELYTVTCFSPLGVMLPGASYEDVQATQVVTDISGAVTLPLSNTEVTYLAPFTGAVSRTQRSKDADVVSILDFGAVNDGVTDDSAALTKALATGRSVVLTDQSGDGYNFGTASFIIATGQFVYGDNFVKVFSQTTSYLFGLAGTSIKASGLGGMNIDMEGAGAASSAIRFLNFDASVYGTRVWDMQFDNCYNSFGDEGSTHYIADNRYYNIKTRYQKGPDVNLRFTQGFQRWDYLNMDYTWAHTGAYLQTWVAFTCNKLAGLQMNECFHTGQELVLNQDTGAAFIPTCGGFSFVGGPSPPTAFDEFIWLRLVRSESSCGFGISFSAIQHIVTDQVGAFSSLGLGVVFDTCELVTCTNLSGRGSYTKTGSVAGGHGVTFKSCLTVMVMNLNVNTNYGSGLRMENTSDALFVNIQSANNSDYGIEETGTSNRNFYGPTIVASNGISADHLLGAASVHVPRPTGTANINTWTARQIFSDGISLPVYTVAGLPSALIPRQKAFVSDATVAYSGAAIGTIPTGGGANLVPVYSTGAVWVIG